jgi:hypothetical protein
VDDLEYSSASHLLEGLCRPVHRTDLRVGRPRQPFGRAVQGDIPRGGSTLTNLRLGDRWRRLRSGELAVGGDAQQTAKRATSMRWEAEATRRLRGRGAYPAPVSRAGSIRMTPPSSAVHVETELVVDSVMGCQTVVCCCRVAACAASAMWPRVDGGRHHFVMDASTVRRILSAGVTSRIADPDNDVGWGSPRRGPTESARPWPQLGGSRAPGRHPGGDRSPARSPLTW